jgi:hypothetical protein
LGRTEYRRFFLSALFCLLCPFFFLPGYAHATTLLTGSGTSTCNLLLNFSSGEKILFIYRFDGTAVRAQAALETIITETGGSLLSTGYLTDFQSALLNLPPKLQGLVVHCQSSPEYPDPYINGILWTPTGTSNGDYLSDVDWWQIWVQGPAHLAQPYNDPATPLDLSSRSGWISPPASGLADITLGNGASLGLVYGSSAAPTPPAPIVQSTRILPDNQLEISFGTIPNISYILKKKFSLNDANWIPITSTIASASTTVFTVPINHESGREFFRLEIAP